MLSPPDSLSIPDVAPHTHNGSIRPAKHFRTLSEDFGTSDVLGDDDRHAPGPASARYDYHRLKGTARFMRLSLSSDGSLCQVPLGTQQGDELAIFLDLDVPCVPR